MNGAVAGNERLGAVHDRRADGVQGGREQCGQRPAQVAEARGGPLLHRQHGHVVVLFVSS